jgi:hypothetical protein
MKMVLKKLGIIDHLSTTLKISQKQFTDRLNQITETGSTSIFSVFSTTIKEYRGQINTDTFTIKRRRWILDYNMNFTVVTAEFTEENNELKVESEINGFNWYFLFMMIGIIFVSILGMISITTLKDNVGLIIIPFLFFQVFMTIGMLYFLMKVSVKRFKYNLERELFYLTKNQ